MKLGKIKYFILLIFMIFMFPLNVLAESLVSIEPNKNILDIGEDVTLSIKITDDHKLHALTATLSYDESVFESIDESDFTSLNEWSNVIYNDASNEFGMINKTGEISDNILTVHLRVKENAPAGNTIVTLNNVSASDGNNKIEFPNETTKILVTRDANVDEVVPSNKEAVNVQKDNNIIKVFTNRYNIITTLILILILVIVMVLINKYNIKNKKKLEILSICLTLFLIIILLSLNWFNYNKKDINKDKKIDYEDSKDIINYIISIKKEDDLSTNTNSKKQSKISKTYSNFDLNNDGYVDIVDVAESVENANKVDYKVDLGSLIVDNYYISKKETINLQFDATVSPSETIKEVIINNKKYGVIKNGNMYNVSLVAPSKKGIYEVKITKVILDNNCEINVDSSIKIEVLKDKPYIDMFNVNDEDNTFNFTLEDKDDALIKDKDGYYKGNVIVTDPNGEEVINKKLKKENHISYEFEKDVVYNVIIDVEYDLDTNYLNDITGEKNNDNLNVSKEIVITNGYNFKIFNVNITDAIEKGEKPVITFESTNDKGFNVDTITIDQKEYAVTKLDGNNYQVVLDKLDTSIFGEYSISIDKVGLNNLKVFEKDKDFEKIILKYNVLKNIPHISNINLTNNKNDKTVNVIYKLNDYDNTLEKLTVILVDSTDKIIDSIEVNKEENVTLSYKNSVDGRYTVKFLASYNLGTDRHSYNDKNIGEKQILTQEDVYIKNATVTTIFPVKGQPKYKVTYEVYVDESIKSKYRYNEVAAVTVNGLNYDANKTGNPYTSTISFTVPSESGILKLEATRVQLRYEDYNNNVHEFFSVKPYIVKIDVLKDKPTIKNLEITNEDYSKGTATFRFNVVDDKGGFNGGNVELNGDKTPIKIGENIVTFKNITKDKTFNLNFYGDYELDTNTLDKDNNENSYKNELIYTIPYGLYSNDKYENINLTNFKAISSDGDEYFEKGEDIKLEFNASELDPNLNLSIEKVIIKNSEYNIEKTNDNYYIVMKGYNSSGLKNIQINEIVLNNGKKITLTNPIKLKVEVLKDPVTIEDFKYEIIDKNINMEFNLNDNDISVFGKLQDQIKIKIFNEDNKLIEEFPYNEKITLKIRENTPRYFVKVYANYDRDVSINNGKNNYNDMLILDKTISIDKNYIELKNITDVTLYKEENGNTIDVEKVDINDLKENKDLYFVKISMSDMPTVYSKINKILEENKRLILLLDYEYVTSESSKTDLRIYFGKIISGFATNDVRPQTFEELISKIEKNPKGTFTLSHDLDASNIKTNSTTLIDVDFQGTLNGNGYTIRNLNKPLFNTIKGGKVENLKLENINFPSSNAQGSLANKVTNSTIKNILIDVFTKNGSEAQTGSLIGYVSDKTNIENCRVKGLNLNVGWNLQQVGGLIGVLENSTVKNCYADGKMSGNWNFIGGLVGDIKGTSTISNSYTKVTMSGSGGVSCDLACSYTGNLIIENNITLSSGFRNNLANKFIKSENNYQLGAESTNNNITSIDKNSVNESLFKDKAMFDDKVWNLSNISYDNIPTLKIENVSKYQKEDNYDKTKEILYNNLSLLMPFYTNEKIVNSSLNISKDNILYNEEIMHIVPIDENGNLVTYLTNDDKDKIRKLKIVFKNKEKITYDVRYDNTYDMVANYRISDLKIDYTFNHYIIDSNSKLIDRLTNYLSNLTYEDNLDKLTLSKDSRIYKEYYDDVTKNELREFVLKYISNSNYENISNSEAVDYYIEKEVKKDQKIEKVLYIYNYLKRFYSVDIDGIMINDLILFDMQGFNRNMNPDNIALKFISNDDNIKLNNTNDTYNRLFYEYTNIETIPEFLEYLVTTLSDLEVDRWYASKFKGYLSEVKIDGRDDIKYTLWDHIKSKDVKPNGTYATWYNYALPIITLPENAAYIISTPTQFIIGAQRTYIIDPSNAESQKSLRDRIKTYSDRMKEYYTNAAKLLVDAKYFNDINTIQIDKRYTYDLNGELIFQNQYTTQEPFHKNFNEVVGVWAYNDYNAATANGTSIIWRVEGLMDGDLSKGSEYTYHTWSHETAHNMDARLFLKNNGRRTGAGGEDYADGNLTQAFGDGDINMNISINYGIDANVTTNLTPQRVNTSEKIHDFYQKMFEVSDFLDYLEALAFLQLSPEEQSKVAVKISYIDENGNETDASNTTRYKVLTEEDFRKMQLKNVEDLWDNQITIKPGVTDYVTVGINRYGGYSLYTRRWYQPHDDNGRPDSYSFKEFAFEMLGYKGYDDGYIEYYSDIHGKDGDLGALRAITNDQNMTFKKYKLNRYNMMKENMKKMKYINAEQVIEDYKNALKLDALNNDRNVKQSTNVKRNNYYYIKRITNDFTTDIYADTTSTDVHVNNKEEFIKAATSNPFHTIVLDNDIDFSNYNSENNTVINNFSGVIKGENHKIYNLNIPLFNTLNGAKVYDLRIEKVNINKKEERLGALSKNAYNSSIKGINLTDITINSNNNKEVGTLIGYMQNTRINNVHSTNFNVSGSTRIGGLIGFGQGGNYIATSSANGNVIGTSNAVGGLAGEANGDTLTNTYALGFVKGATDVGGLVGWADNSSIINNFAKVEISANNDTGGFVGKIVTKANIKNNISFSINNNGYKFDGRTDSNVFENGYSNNYEIEEYVGKTAESKNVPMGTITSIKLENVKNIKFYVTTLGWSQDIWDLSKVESGELPKLKGNDPNINLNIANIKKLPSSPLDENSLIIPKNDDDSSSNDSDEKNKEEDAVVKEKKEKIIEDEVENIK